MCFKQGSYIKKYWIVFKKIHSVSQFYIQNHYFKPTKVRNTTFSSKSFLKSFPKRKTFCISEKEKFPKI